MNKFSSVNQETQVMLEKIISNKDDFLKNDIQSFLVNGISDLLNLAFLKDREFYLEDNGSDKANGFNPTRNVNFGINQIPISVPRSRSGDFYPSLLPKYGRNIGDAHITLMESIILNCKSFKAIASSEFKLALLRKTNSNSA